METRTAPRLSAFSTTTTRYAGNIQSCHKITVDLIACKSTKSSITGSVTNLYVRDLSSYWATSVRQNLCHVSVRCDVVRCSAAVFTLPYRCPGRREQYPRASQTHWSLMWIPTKGKRQPSTNNPPFKNKSAAEGNYDMKGLERLTLLRMLWISLALHVQGSRTRWIAGFTANLFI